MIGFTYDVNHYYDTSQFSANQRDFQKQITLLKSICFHFKTLPKQMLLYFCAKWGKIYFGKNLLQPDFKNWKTILKIQVIMQALNLHVDLNQVRLLVKLYS